MRKSRVVGLTALAAATALVISACSGTPGQAGGSTTAAPAESSGSAAASSGAASGGVGCHVVAGCRERRQSRRFRLRHPARPVRGTGHQGRRGPGGVERSAPVVQQQHDSLATRPPTANIQYFTNTGFTYYDKDLNLINNDQFGTCEIVSLDPLTVKYTVNEGVKWSDGVQVGAADMILSWAAQSGEVQRRGSPDRMTKANCCPVAGVAFDKLDPSLSLITEFPTIGDDGRSATFVWSKYLLRLPDRQPGQQRDVAARWSRRMSSARRR